jgi:hypothetical protein
MLLRSIIPTPANTRVISSTLIPAKGRLDASPLAVGTVAIFRLILLPQLLSELRSKDVGTRLELLKIRFAIF